MDKQADTFADAVGRSQLIDLGPTRHVCPENIAARAPEKHQNVWHQSHTVECQYDSLVHLVGYLLTARHLQERLKAIIRSMACSRHETLTRLWPPGAHDCYHLSI